MNYDLCDPAIRCNADKYEASVFEVEVGRKVVRVLTFSQREAEELARSQAAQPRDGEQEPSLF